MKSLLQTMLQSAREARCPEEVFGDDPSGVKESWRNMAKIAHPDKVDGSEQACAKELFPLLQRWHELALAKIGRGAYGKKDSEDVRLAIGKHTYQLTEVMVSGDLSMLHTGVSAEGRDVLAKVSSSATVNDLLANEAAVLKEVGGKLTPYSPHLPQLLDSAEIQHKTSRRRVNLFAHQPGFYSLAQVKKLYPDGLDPRDAAWMMNRLLAAVSALHETGHVHAAITPDHVLIRPDDHNGMLIDFCYAGKFGQKAKALCPAWRNLYPPEVFAKMGLGPSTDLFMVARVAIWLLGNNAGPGADRFKKFWSGMDIHNPGRRLDDALEVFTMFNDLLVALYGPKKFRMFTMPETTKTKEN